MKKEAENRRKLTLIIICVCILILFFIILYHVVNWQTGRVIDATTPEGAVQQTTGINLNSIPKSQEDLQNISDSYLKKEWGKILANSTVYGPIHNFLTAHQIISLTLFGVGYEVSLSYFLALIFWIIALVYAVKILRTFRIGRTIWAALGLGLIIVIAFAQTGLFYFVAKTLVDLALGQTTWWARLLLWVGIFVIVFLEGYLGKILTNYLRARKKRMNDEDVKHAGEVIKATAKPITEANP